MSLASAEAAAVLKKEPAANSQVNPILASRNLRVGFRKSVSHRALQGIWMRAPSEDDSPGERAWMQLTDVAIFNPRHSALLYLPTPSPSPPLSHQQVIISSSKAPVTGQLESHFYIKSSGKEVDLPRVAGIPSPTPPRIVSLLSSY